MLPSFPESHKEMTEIRNTQMFDALYSVSPILTQIPVRAQKEGKKNSFQDEQGAIKETDYKLVSIPIQIKMEEARGLTMEQFIEVAREPGTGMGKEMLRRLFEMLDNVTKETGNVVNAGGNPISYDLLLTLLEKVQVDFSSDGNPIWPSLTLGSEALTHFKQQFPEWLKDPAFQQRLTTIVERKREEFYEREACRRLVD
ncbi:MAG TPA: hypothetical protein VG347_10945 [Verrucomicrobiae bacterium]|nr:hypothetical protein [Verrucomicrobiae bacterium]